MATYIIIISVIIYNLSNNVYAFYQKTITMSCVCYWMLHYPIGYAICRACVCVQINRIGFQWITDWPKIVTQTNVAVFSIEPQGERKHIEQIFLRDSWKTPIFANQCVITAINILIKNYVHSNAIYIVCMILCRWIDGAHRMMSAAASAMPMYPVRTENCLAPVRRELSYTANNENIQLIWT